MSVLVEEEAEVEKRKEEYTAGLQISRSRTQTPQKLCILHGTQEGRLA